MSEKETKYFCINKDFNFNNKLADHFKDSIDNFHIFKMIRQGIYINKIQLFDCKRKIVTYYKKKWLVPAPEHAIIAARLKGEI